MNRCSWDDECNLEWFAWQCERIRSLLIDNLTCGSEGWEWKKDEEYPEERPYRWRYKCLRYEIGQREFVFHISAIGRGYPAGLIDLLIDRVGGFRHQCKPGEQNFERNVMRIVEKAMIVVISALTCENNQEYFPSTGEVDQAQHRWIGDRFLD